MEWNRETILHFISLIKERPPIWDYHTPEYKGKRKRREAVEEVALLMGVAPAEVNTKWIILRNQYSREKRKIDNGCNNSPYTTKWYAYKDMDALLMYRHKRPNLSTRNFWTQECKSDEESSTSPPPSLETYPPASSDQPHTVELVSQNTMSIFNKAIKSLKSMRETQKDELTNYGLYIAAHLRKFSPALQSKAKYEINKILYALDLESMGEYDASNIDDDITESKDPLTNQKQ